MSNPLKISWTVGGQTKQFRLWAYDITHGGGGATVRAADEFRIQITNGPATPAQIDSGGATDVLIGYSRDRDALVAYDKKWLERWSKKNEETGSGGSPSVQVKESDIQAGHDNKIHHLVKAAGFGEGHIVTMSPEMLPAFLLNNESVLNGSIPAAEAASQIAVFSSMTLAQYCRTRGFSFDEDVLATYVAALLTKPFVILAGVSGTGKSKLAELVAEYYSRTRDDAGASAGSVPATGDGYVFADGAAAPDSTRFALIAVRPDWIDNQSILGFVNPITGRYESTQSLDLILRANAALGSVPDPAQAPRHFMLLDEMNLARVEHYFSDWLACTESRRYSDGTQIVQQSVPLHRGAGELTAIIANPDGSHAEMPVPSSLPIPINLIVTGTVNVDETTYGFSPKVLDRAFVLEFDDVELSRLRGASQAGAPEQYSIPQSLPPFRMPVPDDYKALPIGAQQHIERINDILKSARLHIGYRAANEMGLFMTIYNPMLPPMSGGADDAILSRALDAAVLHKILPRLSGSRAKLEAPLAKLCGYLRDLQPLSGDALTAEFDEGASASLPKSYRRAVEMLSTLRDFGFVSFFK
ncbi:MAG: hypothetical protein KDJ17_05080 [Hyphomicrobiaceae bacterium]|nr:hypothetical protein [Hyphomicrobiaceae bacterium]